MCGGWVRSLAGDRDGSWRPVAGWRSPHNRGPPLALKTLREPLKVEAGPYVLIAAAAARTSHGTNVELHLERENVALEVTVCNVSSHTDRTQTAERLAEVSGERRGPFEAALVQVASGVEGLLRKGEAIPRVEKADKPSTLCSDPEPWPESMPTAGVLEEVVRLLARYVVLPAEKVTAVALFIAYTHVFDSFEVSPYLGITSATMGCGKSRLMSVLRHLVARPLATSNASPASVFRSVELWHPTLLVDEGDTFLKLHDELRGILNSGHTRDTAAVLRVTGEQHEPASFSTWSPKVFALIGELPPTLADRSVVIRIVRKRTDEKTARLLTGQLMNVCLETRRRLVRWGQDNQDALRHSLPPVPDELSDRAADNWSPLLAVADLAGEEWPERARRAAVSLSTAAAEPQEFSVMALHDVWTLLELRGPRIRTEDVVAALVRLEERPWSAYPKDRCLDARTLAGLLKSFGIRPRDARIDGGIHKTYGRDQFLDAISRYPMSPPPQLSGLERPNERTDKHLGVADDPPRHADVAEVAPQRASVCESTPSSPKPVCVADRSELGPPAPAHPRRP